VQQLDEELELHPAHRWGDRRQLKKHRRRMEELAVEIEERQRLLHFRSNRHWDTFLALIDVLRHFGALAGDEGLEPTEIGRTVAALRGDNELWLGLALMSGHLDELPPAELAAVFEAISTEVNRPDLWCGFPPPPAVDEALHDLRGLRRELGRQQERAKVAFPIWWEPELTGLVEAWARGTSWSDVIANTSLDEGDVVRLLRRTVDLLAQVPYCEAVSQQLRDNARAALKAINRFPVCELDDLLPKAPAAIERPKPDLSDFASPHSDLEG
jgi:superfamily II RNA helicase